MRPEQESKQSYSLFAGLAQIINRDAALQSTLNYQVSTGYLSDPYKQALVAGTPLGDSRPDLRNQVTWLTRYRHHVDKVNGTLHADYRFYFDDWEITSHTLEVAWYQSLWNTIRLTPSFRYYSQSQAGFYAPYYTSPRSDGYYSSDYRLSPYGALSWRIKAETFFQTWNLDWKGIFSFERYVSSGDFALGKVSVENPGLVSYNVFSIGLTGRF